MTRCQSQQDHGWIPVCLCPSKLKVLFLKHVLSLGSKAYTQMKSITSDKRLLKDVAQMSPHGQTFALEAFHSVLIDFAPKSQAFSPEGMLGRTRLAILHFNENSDRCQAVTKEGKPRWSVVASKARKGHFTARPEPTETTYGQFGRKSIVNV